MTEATPLASEQITQEDRITAAIREADAAFGYSFNLTRLVHGEETHTLSMPGFDPVEFSDRDEGYALIAERRNKARAEAVLAALSASPAPSGQDVSGDRDEATVESIRRLQFKADFQRGYGADWFSLDRADADRILAALAAPAPSCAPGEVERVLVPKRPTDEMLEASAIEWTRLCHGYPPEDGHYKFMRALWSAMLEAAPAALSPQRLDAKEGECPSSPDGRHQVDTSMESGLNNCFHCEAPMEGN